MTAAATAQMSAVQHAVPLPPTSTEPRSWFDPVIEPDGESLQAGPLTGRFVPRAAAYGPAGPQNYHPVRITWAGAINPALWPTPGVEEDPRLVPVAELPGVVAAALVPAEPTDPLADCLPAGKGLLADLADAGPLKLDGVPGRLTFAYLVRSLGWDGRPPEDPIADLVSTRAAARPNYVRRGRPWL